MLKISVNDHKHEFTHSLSLQALLENLEVKTQGIAVAINTEVILKSAWETTSLKNDDNVLIIQATQGG